MYRLFVWINEIGQEAVSFFSVPQMIFLIILLRFSISLSSGLCVLFHLLNIQILKFGDLAFPTSSTCSPNSVCRCEALVLGSSNVLSGHFLKLEVAATTPGHPLLYFLSPLLILMAQPTRFAFLVLSTRGIVIWTLVRLERKTLGSLV